MGFLTQFFGSFYSANCYAQLRQPGRSYGAAYSITLFLLTMAAVFAVMLVHIPAGVEPKLVAHVRATPIEGWLLIIGIAAPLRALMLLTLAIAARLQVIRKNPMDYATAWRFVGVAYTPVAVADAAVFCAHGYMANPLLLFVLGYMMLLAALRATR